MAEAYACDNCGALFLENTDWNDYAFEERLGSTTGSFRLSLEPAIIQPGKSNDHDAPDLCPVCVDVWINGLIVILESYVEGKK